MKRSVQLREGLRGATHTDTNIDAPAHVSANRHRKYVDVEVVGGGRLRLDLSSRCFEKGHHVVA